jgi:hypothetical protein
VTTRTAVVCACGSAITGCGFTEATNPGTFLCPACAADANREHPGSVVRAFVLVDFDDCARDVAAALAAVWLDDTRHCPRADRCEACGGQDDVEMRTLQTSVGVYCAPLCESCADFRPLPLLLSWSEAIDRVVAHCGHLGIDVDEMAALIAEEEA